MSGNPDNLFHRSYGNSIQLDIAIQAAEETDGLSLTETGPGGNDTTTVELKYEETDALNLFDAAFQRLLNEHYA